MSSTRTNYLAITPGEPAGIGPELILSIAKQHPHLPIVAFADIELLRERAQQINIAIELVAYHPGQVIEANQLAVVHHPVKTKVIPGILNPANAEYVLATLQSATRACLNGEFRGLVTGPINKAVINQAGTPFSGHTEYLAALTDTALPVMLLMSPTLKVALVTTHIPLADVPAAITPTRLLDTMHILHHDCQTRFHIEAPRILVCGLNPHAGENGHIGQEEQEILIPVIQRCQQQGMRVMGPVSADTAFTAHQLQQADVVLAMFHDQGLPVIKAQDFGDIVNVTLGLPIFRSSVDHGPALSLAGTGTANPASFLAAIELAHAST